MRHILTCRNCKNLFDSKDRRRKFCSKICYESNKLRFYGSVEEFKNEHEEHAMWLWYWEVFFGRKKVDPGMKKIWEYYNYLFYTQKFTRV